MIMFCLDFLIIEFLFLSIGAGLAAFGLLGAGNDLASAMCFAPLVCGFISLTLWGVKPFIQRRKQAAEGKANEAGDVAPPLHHEQLIRNAGWLSLLLTAILSLTLIALFSIGQHIFPLPLYWAIADKFPPIGYIVFYFLLVPAFFAAKAQPAHKALFAVLAIPIVCMSSALISIHLLGEGIEMELLDSTSLDNNRYYLFRKNWTERGAIPIDEFYKCSDRGTNCTLVSNRLTQLVYNTQPRLVVDPIQKEVHVLVEADSSGKQQLLYTYSPLQSREYEEGIEQGDYFYGKLTLITSMIAGVLLFMAFILRNQLKARKDAHH